MRRGLFLSIVAAMLLASGVCYGQQSTYPTRQVRIVVPYPAGGPTDLIARLVAQKLGERLGQSFFVENVAGASGAVGAGQVAHAAPDGYTLLVSTNDFAVASVTNANLPYDPVKNFSPVTIIATSPQVVAVNPSVPAKNMKELVDLIKAAPEKYNYAAIGIGFGQLTSERLFKLALKLDGLVRVPFNGAAPAVNATLAGDTQIIFLALPPIAPYLSSEKLRALAVTSPARTPAFPQIPTLREAGIPDQEADLINGMVGADRHAAGDHRAPAKRDRRDRATARLQGDARQIELPAGRQHVGGICKPDQERHRGLEQSDEGRQHPGQLNGV